MFNLSLTFNIHLFRKVFLSFLIRMTHHSSTWEIRLWVTHWKDRCVLISSLHQAGSLIWSYYISNVISCRNYISKIWRNYISKFQKEIHFKILKELHFKIPKRNTFQNSVGTTFQNSVGNTFQNSICTDCVVNVVCSWEGEMLTVTLNYCSFI